MTSNAIPHKSNLIRRALFLFVCMITLQMIYVATVFTMVEQTSLQVAEQQEARRALSSIGRLMRSVQDLIICMGRGEILGAEGSEVQYLGLLESLNRELRSLKTTLANKSQYARTIAEIETTCQAIPEIYEELHGKKNGHGHERGRKKRRRKRLRESLRFHMEDKIMIMGKSDIEWLRVYMSASEVLARLEAIQADYRQVEKEAQEHLKFQSSLLFNAALFMGFAATVLVAFLLYHIFISGIVARLRMITNTLDDIADGKPLQDRSSVEADGAPDEVGHLALELQSMERALRNIRSKEKTLLENAASCICSIDEQGKFVTVSQASTILWGVAPDELLGTALIDLVEKADVDYVDEKLNELFRTRRPVTFECRVRQSEGAGVEFAWTASLATDQNLAVCVAHDVTKRNEILRQIKQRETEFRAMVDCMPIALITCDQLNAISSINPATQRMLKYSPQELLGKKLSTLLFGGTKSGVATNEQMNEVLATAEKHTIELLVSKADGSRLPVEFSSSHYELHDSRVRLATFKDVSARFEIETGKKELVAMISHDLRSPLTAIHCTLELLGCDKKRTSGEDLKNAEDVSRAEKIVFSIVNVLNDFLDLEKFQAGLVALELDELAISELMSELQEELGSRDKPVHFSLDQDAEVLETRVKVDFSRMLFALSTIIPVIDCFREETLELEISRSGDQVLMEIKNGNIPEHIENAFQSPYVFLSDAELNGVVSSGLSLSLSRAIIGAHSGAVRIDRNNVHCRVEISLPKA